MKQKILFIAGGSYISGLEIVNLHLIRELKKNGYDVLCLINKWNDGRYKQALMAMDVPFEEAKLGWIYFRRPLWTMDTLIHYPAAFLKIRKVMKRFQPDIVHFCSFASVIMLFPLLRGYNCVYNLQEPHESSAKNRAIYALMKRRIRVFTAVSSYIEKVLINLGIPEPRIRVVFNGVPVIERFSGKSTSEKEFVFGIIGQVVPWKGHHTLIDAVELLSIRTQSPFLIYIFGNDQTDYAREQKERIKEKRLERYFVWEGFVSGQDLIYDQVDAVIVPSLSGEPCSLTILEAMMRRKVVIVSDRGGNTELVENKRTGLVFAAGDPAELVHCMSLLLGQQDLVKELGDRAGDNARKSLTDVRMANDYIKIYEELTGKA